MLRNSVYIPFDQLLRIGSRNELTEVVNPFRGVVFVIVTVRVEGQRMRAARVVLDIGVHLGKQRPDGDGVWTADYALHFMRNNVLLEDEFVRFEVNRYLGWPGQAP